MRRSHGLDLRRRAAAVPGNRRAGRGYPFARQVHSVLVFNVHLDGMEKNHDLAVEREGVFKLAIEGIRAAKAGGFKVFSNTTVYRETDMNEIWRMFEYLEQFKLDGHSISRPLATP